LPAGVQAGIGVGITGGILLLLGAYALVYRLIRKQGKLKESNEMVEKKSDDDGTGWRKPELDGGGVDRLKDVQEMSGEPIIGLESNQKAAELSNYSISELDSLQLVAKLDGLGKGALRR